MTYKLLPPFPLPQEDRLDSPEAGKGYRVPKMGVKAEGAVEKTRPGPPSAEGGKASG